MPREFRGDHSLPLRNGSIDSNAENCAQLRPVNVSICKSDKSESKEKEATKRSRSAFPAKASSGSTSSILTTPVLVSFSAAIACCENVFLAMWFVQQRQPREENKKRNTCFQCSSNTTQQIIHSKVPLGTNTLCKAKQSKRM